MTQILSALPAGLPSDALSAWHAYVAMVNSKNAHFDYLTELEDKYANGGRRTLAELAHLEGLLSVHHEAVEQFKNTQKTLIETNRNAHAKFVEILATVNASLGAN